MVRNAPEAVRVGVAGPGRRTVRVTVNGEPTDYPEGTTLDAVVETLGIDRRGVAVAVDREVVPRSEWATLVLREGCAVEVVSAAAGG